MPRSTAGGLSFWSPTPEEHRTLLRAAKEMGIAGQPDVRMGPVAEEPNPVAALRRRVDQLCHEQQQACVEHFRQTLTRMAQNKERLSDPYPTNPIDRAQRDHLEFRLEADWREAQLLQVQLRAVLNQVVEAGNALAQGFAAELQANHPHPNLVDTVWVCELIEFPEDCMRFGFEEAEKIIQEWTEYRRNPPGTGDEEGEPQ